jgi:hypothetical protein
MDLELLAYKYHNSIGLSKYEIENEIRKHIHDLSLKIIEHNDEHSIKIRHILYRILNNEPILRLIKKEE